MSTVLLTGHKILAYWRECSHVLPMGAAVRLGVADDLAGLFVRAPAAESPPWAINPGGVPWHESAAAVLLACNAAGVTCSVHAIGHDLSVYVPAGVSAAGCPMTGLMQSILVRGWPERVPYTQRVVYLCADVRAYIATVARRYRAGFVGAVVCVGDDLTALCGVPNDTGLVCCASDSSALRSLYARVRLWTAARQRAGELHLLAPVGAAVGWQ